MCFFNERQAKWQSLYTWTVHITTKFYIQNFCSSSPHHLNDRFDDDELNSYCKEHDSWKKIIIMQSTTEEREREREDCEWEEKERI